MCNGKDISGYDISNLLVPEDFNDDFYDEPIPFSLTSKATELLRRLGGEDA
jgi:hypothetical protein